MQDLCALLASLVPFKAYHLTHNLRSWWKERKHIITLWVLYACNQEAAVRLACTWGSTAQTPGNPRLHEAAAKIVFKQKIFPLCACYWPVLPGDEQAHEDCSIIMSLSV